ncbi:response regulator [Microbulbifer sp. OS29]|uniref:Response regulator n=1 Tax=Microbulbifer okhotskensis TaxID=2926617 RepID=A0A9X2J507_9GAMM|nr:response regulator [Microbulbifer okhotskensis]MCO1334708.1 response regulator [Microbulbifer okhotskensis]
MIETTFSGGMPSRSVLARAICLGLLVSGSVFISSTAQANAIDVLQRQIPAFWLGIPILLLILVCATAISRQLKLGELARETRTRIKNLSTENSGLSQQIHGRNSEFTVQEKQLADTRGELEQLRQEKSDLLTVTRHHLQHPLDTLLGTLNLLARSEDNNTRALVEIGKRQLNSALKSLEDLHRCDKVETVELKLPAETNRAPAAQLSVLLIENSKHDSLQPSLEAMAHNVQRECNGIDGSSAALQKKFDLILTDTHLPLMDGVEAVREIRRERGSELPIFALLQNASSGDKERYQARGFTGVLTHPIGDRQLMQLMSWALRRSQGVGGLQSIKPTRLLNANTLFRQRDTLDHQTFAELLSERTATLPKHVTALTSAITGRHWLDAEQQAQGLSRSAAEVGLETIAARLRTLAANLSIDSEREHCRQQRTELLQLMRESVRQLKAWRERNVHTEWALK